MIPIILEVHGNGIANQEKVSFLMADKIQDKFSVDVFLGPFRYEAIKVIMKRPILNIKSGQRMIIRDPKNNPHRQKSIIPMFQFLILFQSLILYIKYEYCISYDMLYITVI